MSRFSVKDLHVAVTGASSGIGAAIARRMATAGARVTVVARRQERLEALVGELPGESHVAVADLAQDPTGWLAASEKALGPIEVLVNNAGVQIIGDSAEVDPDAGARSLVVNLEAPLRLIRAVLPGMKMRRFGAIVNIASMAALAPTPGMLWYNASKAGLAGASEALRGELLKTSVRVLTVYPGIIPTDMGNAGLAKYASRASMNLQPQGTPEGLAERVERALAKGRPRVVYPEVYAVARWAQPLARWAMDRFTPPLA